MRGRLGVVVGLLLCGLPSLCQGYCKSLGWNPSWSGPPMVQQLTLTSVRVSWAGLLQQAECADNILVKHYRGIDSNNYKMSDILDKEVTSYIVHDLTPDAEYTYQVIAREEKWTGIDYNRGEKTTFTTSVLVRQQGLEVEREDPLPTTRVDSGLKEESALAPVYPDSQRAKSLVAGLQVEVLVMVIIGLVVVCIVTIGLVYNCVRKKGPEKDLELNSASYEDDGDDEDEEDEEDDEDDEDEDEFEDSAKDTKKYDMMAELNKQQLDNSKLLRPMSVP